MRRRSKPFVRTSFTFAALVALAGCGHDDAGPYFGTTERAGKDPHTFYVNNLSEPEYLDPGKSADGLSAALILQLFEGLTAYDPRDMHPVQGVAERWDRSDDNRLYRFHLRADARWSDGRPVTAHDFEYSWKRVLRPSSASRAVDNLKVLKNGELLADGKLLALREARPLLAEARAGAAQVAALPKGALVRVLEPPAKDAKLAKVQRFDDLPTFRAGAAPAPAEAAPTGFLSIDDLVEDTRPVGVRATDDRTLEVELERPTPYFLDLTSYTSLMPVRKDVVERFEQRGEDDLWTRPENIVTNGAYTLDEWKFRYEITMKRNPHYWNRDKLQVHRIVWMEVEESHAAMNLYKAGELDYLGDNVSPPAEYLPLLKTRRDYRNNYYLSVYWYELNVTKPPLDDARVRRALNLAIDKKQIVEKISRGGQLPATHFVPDFTGMGYADQVKADRAAGKDPFTGPEVEFNPERARELLKEAGFPVEQEGDGLRARGMPPIEILYNTMEGHRAIAVAVQDMWKRHLGVSAALRNEEWRVMLKNLHEGNFQVARGGWTADYNHAQTFLDQFVSTSPQNFGKWVDKDFDEAVKRAAAEPDPKESIRLFREAELKAVHGAARIPFYFYTKSSLVKPWVKGLHASPRNAHLFQYFWIDRDWRSHEGDNSPAYPPPELPPPGPYGGAP